MLNGKRLAGNGGWRQLAPLVPLALFAGAFTISATDDPSVAITALEQSAQGPKPHPVVVPRQAVTDPANLPVPGTVGNGVPWGEESTQVVSGLSRNGIPMAALKAYSRAQQVLAQADPGCQLPWTLVAAIGRVESDHGRFGGSSLNGAGVATPGILGPRLDGVTTARIVDTDAGRYDADPAFDRAVGPMQFIPGTWRQIGVDGDGDGIRDPQDIDDAAMSTGVYLCSGDTNLAEPGDRSRALLRYNHSQAYVTLVTRIAEAYEGGSWIAVGNGVTGDDEGSDRAVGEVNERDVDAPADPDLPQARGLPERPRPTSTPEPPQPPSTRGTTRPTPGRPSAPDHTATPGRRPTNEPPAHRPPTSPTTPSAPAAAAVLRTAAGTIVGVAGSTVAELSQAARYCQSELAEVTITHPTQEQLQDCVTAYQTGGTAAADQAIRDLLSLLGLLGILGGGILGS